MAHSRQRGCRRAVAGFSATAVALIAMCAALAPGAGLLPEAWADTYHVNSTAGEDANDGLAPESAWRTIAKVNRTGLNPGDSVLFRRGCEWREELRPRSSGSHDQPITFGTYGDGEGPRIVGSDPVGGWTMWDGNVWRARLTAAPYQVFFDGRRGACEQAPAGLDAEREWCWEKPDLLVYASADPTMAFAPGGVEATVRDCIFLWRQHYVQIEDLCLLRGKYGAYVGQGCSHISCLRVESAFHYYDGLAADGDTCADILVADCVAHDNLRHGAFAHDMSRITVTGGRYHGNAERYGSGVGLDGVRCGVVARAETFGNFYGIKAANGACEVLIEGNDVHDNLDVGIDLDIGCRECAVEGNRCHGNGSHGIMVELDSRDCEVRRNLCYRNGAAHAGIFVERAANVAVFYNVVRDEYIGVRFNERATGCAAWNNAAYNISGVGFSVFNDCSNITLRNNVASRCAGLCLHVREDSRRGFSSDHNDWHAAGRRLRWGRTRLTFEEWQATTGCDAHSLCRDPLFRAPEQGDFHLRPESPCRDAGADVDRKLDYQGRPVPQGGVPDMGAFEYGAQEQD